MSSQKNYQDMSTEELLKVKKELENTMHKYENLQQNKKVCL